MKKIFNISILYYVFIYGFLLLIFKNILNLFNMEFLSWVYEVSFILIFIGIIAAIVQFGIKLDLNQYLKVVFIVMVSLFITIIFGIIGFILIFYNKLCSEYIDYVNNKKIIVHHENYLLHGTYKNYKYINCFIRGAKIIYEENY